MRSSVELLSSHEYEPQPLALARQSTGLLTRQTTGMSEISRILSGLSYDREQDTAEFVRYRSQQQPEELLVQQLELVQEDDDSGASEHDLEKVRTADNEYPVDGKFAFWQAFLAMLMVFSSWGPNAAFGVFLNYYLAVDAFPGATKYEFALMGGFVVFLAQVTAPIVALGVRVLGQTPVHMVGIVGQTVAYFLAAQCTHFWQLFLCQGVLPGFFFSFVFIPGTLVIPTWFDKRRATAMGLAVSGAGVGGVVFSLSLNAIIKRTGDQKWALRTVGIISLATSVFAATFLRPRNKKRIDYAATLNWGFIARNFRVVFDFSIFYNLPMVFVGVWFGLCMMAYVIVLYSLAAYASSVGLSSTQSSTVLAVLNTMQAVGRPCFGNVGDFFGRNNAATAICCYLGIMLTALWLNAQSYAAVLVLAILMGGPVGVGSLFAQSLALDVLTARGAIDKLPAAWGGLNFIVSWFALPAEIVALKLRIGTGVSSFKYAQIYTGCLFFAAALLMLVNREWLVRKKFAERRAAAESKANTYLRREGDDAETLRMRIEWYDRLLARSVVYYFVRMFYPIRV